MRNHKFAQLIHQFIQSVCLNPYRFLPGRRTGLGGAFCVLSFARCGFRVGCLVPSLGGGLSCLVGRICHCMRLVIATVSCALLLGHLNVAVIEEQEDLVDPVPVLRGCQLEPPGKIARARIHFLQRRHLVGNDFGCAFTQLGQFVNDKVWAHPVAQGRRFRTEEDIEDLGSVAAFHCRWRFVVRVARVAATGAVIDLDPAKEVGVYG